MKLEHELTLFRCVILIVDKQKVTNNADARLA